MIYYHQSALTDEGHTVGSYKWTNFVAVHSLDVTKLFMEQNC